MFKVKIRRVHLLKSGDGAINRSGHKTRQHVLTGNLRKVRRIYNLYISSCIGDRAPNGVPSESPFKDILFEWESTARGHCTGEREGIFVMSSFTGTREDQYSDEADFHLDCKVNSQNLRLRSLGKSDVVAEVLFYLDKNKIWCMSDSGVTGPILRI